MAGMVLRKTGAALLIIMKILLYMAVFSARAAGFLLKIFLLLFLLVLRLVLAVSGISGKG